MKLTDYCKAILKDDTHPDSVSAVEINGLTPAQIEKLITKILITVENHIDFYITQHQAMPQCNNFYLLCIKQSNPEKEDRFQTDKKSNDKIQKISSFISARLNQPERKNTPPVIIEKISPSVSPSCVYIPILPNENISPYESEMKILYLHENYQYADNIQARSLQTPEGIMFHYIKGEVGTQRTLSCRYSDLNSEIQVIAFKKANEISQMINKDRKNNPQLLHHNPSKQKKTMKPKSPKL